jgi:hypothetical protein
VRRILSPVHFMSTSIGHQCEQTQAPGGNVGGEEGIAAAGTATGMATTTAAIEIRR